MKILRMGSPSKLKIPIFRGKCEVCSCEVEVTQDEVHVMKSLIPGGLDDLLYVHCPIKGCRSNSIHVKRIN